MAKVKTLSVNHPIAKKLGYFPNFHKSGSIRGMKKLLLFLGIYIYYEAH